MWIALLDTSFAEEPAATAPEATPPEAAAPAAAPDEPAGPIVAVVPSPRAKDLSLTRVEADGGWIVRDGRGREVDAKTWALLTGDPDVLAKIAEARRKEKVLGWALVAGGGVVAAASVIPAMTIEDALGTNESLPGFEEVGARNDARVLTAFSLVGAGALLAGTGLAANLVADRRSLALSRHLDAAAVDERIAAHNARIAALMTVVTPEGVDPNAQVAEQAEPAEAPAVTPP
ncbi:MAG: hypothetical protein ACOZNI_08460 [Myxococcota bacterium]